jgi:AAHS family 4-hydroxybenzoate transporter-like MFS transporter
VIETGGYHQDVGENFMILRVDLSAALDDRPLGRFQRSVVALCFLVSFVDGYDLVAISYAAPAMRAAGLFQPSQLGSIFSAALLGAMAGNFVCGPLGDTLGRRKVIIFSTLLFGAFTLATAFATSFSVLIAIRFIAGFGLGAANISCYALSAEYAPKKRGESTVMLVAVGYTIGAALGGFFAAFLVPAYGWPAVFYVGGACGLLLAVLLILKLPESIRFLVAQRARHGEVTNVLRKIDPERQIPAGTEYFILEDVKKGFSGRHLFSSGYAIATLLFWLMCFMNLMELFFVQQWLPTLANSSGINLTSAVSAGAILQIGALSGALLYAFVLQGYHRPFLLLAFGFTCGAASFVLLGQTARSVPLFMLCVFATGLFVPGLQIALNGIIAMHYPTFIRSTGLSWAIGIGRIGSVFGPVFAGLLLAWQWTPSQVLSAAALPALISTIAALAMAVKN